MNKLLVLKILLMLTPATIFSDLFAQSQQEPEGKYVTVGGHRIWYRIAGNGEPLLIVPGGPGSPHDLYYPHFESFSDSFKVIYFDAYGRGKSDHAKDPHEYSFVHDVDEVEGLRQALSLGKINLYGHSYGGMVAQGYALKYPQSLKRMILANTLHSAEMWQKGNNDTWNMELQNQYPELWARLDSLRAMGLLSCDPAYQNIEGEIPLSLIYYYDPTNSDAKSYSSTPLNLEVYAQIAGPDADIVIGGDVASLDFRGQLAKINVPTLIFAGRFDRVSIPRYSTQFKKFMPKAHFVMFERSGHFPFFEEPDRHDKILREFLKR